MTFAIGDVVRLVSVKDESSFYEAGLGRVGRVESEPMADGNHRRYVTVSGLLPDEHTLRPYLDNLEPATEEDWVYQRAMEELQG